MSAPHKDRLDNVPLRDIPATAWTRIAVSMLIVVILGMIGWEAYWRDRGFVPAYRDGLPLWSMVHRRLEREPVGSIAIIGSSRVLFDMELGVWERETSRLPIQLALPGTNPRPILRHIAADTDFAGLLVVGVAPPLFFTPPEGGVFDGAPEYARDQSPSQWFGHQLSMLVEPYLAFYYPDAALFFILRRQTWWGSRSDFVPPPREVRRLEVSRKNRQSDMWEGIEDNEELRLLAQDIWRDVLRPPAVVPPPDVAEQMLTQMIQETVQDVRTIQARGGEVVFARMPSEGEFRETERQVFPREAFWDRLVAETGALGIHFEDHPELQRFRVPEWSHVHSDDIAELTENFLEILRREFTVRGIQRPELQP